MSATSRRERISNKVMSAALWRERAIYGGKPLEPCLPSAQFMFSGWVRLAQKYGVGL